MVFYYVLYLYEYTTVLQLIFLIFIAKASIQTEKN